MISILFIAAIAMQVEPPSGSLPDAPIPPANIKTYGPRIMPPNREARANEICTLNGCSSSELYRFQLEWSGFAEAPVGMNVDGKPAVQGSPSDACNGSAFLVQVQAPPDRDLTVDWEGATFVVDGSATPAVPGFALKMTTSLTQRKVRIPRGTNYAEHVYPAAEDICIFPTPKNREPNAITSLDVIVLDGERRENVHFSTTRRLISISEPEAFSMLKPPLQQLEPQPSTSWPFWTGIGLGTGLVLGAGVCAGTSLLINTNSSPDLSISQILGCSTCSGLTGATAGTVAGVLADGRSEMDSKDWEKRAAPWETWAATRKRLGLEVPSTSVGAQIY